MLIAYLAALSPTDRFWYTRFSQIAKDMGPEIRYARLAGQDFEGLTNAFRRGLDEGDAFFMPDDTVLYSEEYTEQLHDRIRTGARVLVRRRLVGHLLKKHVAGYSFSDEEGQLLREADDLAKRLLGSFRASGQT
jgi:hypothetical protein